MTRVLRVYPAPALPDLTVSVLAAIAAERDEFAAAVLPSAAVRERTAPGVIRLTLALVAAAQVLIAAPALLGNDLGAPVHVAHEQGAWGLALAVGFAFAAWQPLKAGALIPILAAFVACMAVLGFADVGAGRAAPAGELPHVMSVLGLSLLWLEAHPPTGLQHPHVRARRPVAV